MVGGRMRNQSGAPRLPIVMMRGEKKGRREGGKNECVIFK